MVDEIINLGHGERATIALLKGKVQPALAAAGGALVGVEDPDRELKPLRDVVDHLGAPFYPGGIDRKSQVVYVETARTRIDSDVEIIVEDWQGAEGSTGREASSRNLQ